MSDTSGNGGAPDEPQQPQAAPSLNVVAQYVKDLSFENPDSPNSLRSREQQPQIGIAINVQANQLSESEFEVELKLDATAKSGEKTMFAVELVYGGVFRAANVPKESMLPLAMIECPRLLFPFARQVIAEATRNGGFPPLLIDPVDFNALYRQRMSEMAAKQQSQAPGEGTA